MGAAEAAAAARQSAVDDASERLASLTDRQREYAISLINGLTPRQVAETLNVSEHTTTEMMQKVRKKMGSGNPYQLGYLLAQGGLK